MSTDKDSHAKAQGSKGAKLGEFLIYFPLGVLAPLRLCVKPLSADFADFEERNYPRKDTKNIFLLPCLLSTAYFALRYPLSIM